MWKAIKAALRAIGEVMSRTTSAFAYGFASTGDWLIERWNWWSRSVSGTAYRPTPVTDLRDEITDITTKPDAPVPAPDDLTELGRRVRLAAQAILDGAEMAPDDLPGEVQVWLVARSHYDLTLTVRASDQAVGRHMAGLETLWGPHGSEVPGIDVRRDERIVMSRVERSKPRVVEEYEREGIREMFSVRMPVVPVEPPSPVALTPRPVMAPSY